MFYQEERIKKTAYEAWRNSEGMFRMKAPGSREQKTGLTGYVSYREERKQMKESLRFENSYGTIALGGDKRRGLMILASEKRRHNSGGITGKEKALWESRKTERPIGRGKVIANAGGMKEGAFAFLHQPESTRFEMMGKMKQYASSHRQETLRRMMPFLEDREDLVRKRSLEERARTMREEGKASWAGRLNRVREEEDRIRQQKCQMEDRFSQKLVQAMKDAKKEPLEGAGQQSIGYSLLSMLADGLREQPDEKTDETNLEGGTTDSDSETEKGSGK